MRKFLILIFLLASFIFLLSSRGSYAELSNIPECRDKNLDKAQCEKYLSDRLTELQGQKRTLSSQIAVMDSQISLTEARIESTKEQIGELGTDISIAKKKINNLEKSLDDLIQKLLHRMIATYEIGQSQPFGILVSSTNANNFFSRLNYLKIVREHDKQLILLTQQAKSDYNNQKNIFEDKKFKAERLKASLESYTIQLEREKAAKRALLSETQGDADKFQALLEQARAELAVTFGGGTETFMRDVNMGDAIGSIISGQSGCSTGSHLHFEVHKNNNPDDPSSYLSTTSFSYYPSGEDVGSVNPHGSWPWPINQTIYITQGYGMTPYAQSGAYGGRPHYGIDMFNNSLAVKAVAGGHLYRGSYQCSNGTLFYAKVKQSDGVDVLYLHMIPN